MILTVSFFQKQILVEVKFRNGDNKKNQINQTRVVNSIDKTSQEYELQFTKVKGNLEKIDEWEN
jgi:hypothetical protein